jgi:hypothetical protein
MKKKIENPKNPIKENNKKPVLALVRFLPWLDYCHKQVEPALVVAFSFSCSCSSSIILPRLIIHINNKVECW